jgi:hypothetical protein
VPHREEPCTAREDEARARLRRTRQPSVRVAPARRDPAEAQGRQGLCAARHARHGCRQPRAGHRQAAVRHRPGRTRHALRDVREVPGRGRNGDRGEPRRSESAARREGRLRARGQRQRHPDHARRRDRGHVHVGRAQRAQEIARSLGRIQGVQGQLAAERRTRGGGCESNSGSQPERAREFRYGLQEGREEGGRLLRVSIRGARADGTAEHDGVLRGWQDRNLGSHANPRPGAVDPGRPARYPGAA